jgi:ketosteroid isomerase-like protein
LEVVLSPDEFMRAYEAVLNAHDLDGTLALIADDAVFLFSNETSHIGKAAVAEAIRANFDAIRLETYRVSGLRWLAESGDAAACVYEFHWAGEIGGQAMSGGGRGTNVLRRVDGEWQVAHEHLSRGGL